MDNGKYVVPLVELELPETGLKLKIAKFLTIAQSRELQKMLLKGGNFNAEAGKLENVSADVFLEMQDRAAELLIKEIVQTDGSLTPFTMDLLGNLPVSDGNLVYDEINKLVNNTSLTDEAKKKS